MGDFLITLEWQNDEGHHQKEFDLATHSTIRIGRHSDNDIVIVKSTLSRYQAEIKMFGRNIQLANISQTNPFQVVTDKALETLAPEQTLLLRKGFKIDLHGAIVNILELKAPGTGDTDPLDQPMVECPKCKRTLPANLDECPYDGWSLAAARTVLIDVRKLQGDSE